MAWSGAEDYGDSAGRLFTDGETLYAEQRWETAGHLYGVAAECAVKAALGNIRLEGKKGNFIHFPDLKVAMLQSGQTRHMLPLLNTLSRLDFLDSWSVNGRYAKNDGSVDEPLCTAWRRDAADTLLDCGFIV